MLALGLQTVRSYRKTMMKKLSVNNVAGLTQLALAAGLTKLPGPPIREAQIVREQLLSVSAVGGE